ncbi:PC-esterase domain-containing protein 1A-like isoform X3 [Myripristis murdjan]|uniref:PC-esterase domain-containing protein 1A-like isoform X3 n=1 Tax=Myripristis murdjan TaxID=586833 RepID=UPI001175D173|nr:PC-esterase domain-containing protein 1A-like isoform X3 [Myripristis murdjan]
MRFVTQSQARQLLHNKFVVVLGGSVHRSIYKDLVVLLQKDRYLTPSQLKSKGELSFERDCLVEGGQRGPMTNGTEYREVRQYRSDHHLLRFYFLTRVYSPYMESILEDFRCGLKPDVVIVNSCLWDITRYGRKCLPEYRENLHKFFGQMKATVCHDCLILWLLSMPVGKKIKGGFLVPEIHHLGPTLRYDVIEANFYGGRLASAYGLDVLDLHFQFRFSLRHRMPDGIHWDAVAHRRITSLLLQHIAQAWGVQLYSSTPPSGQVFQSMELRRRDFTHHSPTPVWLRPRPLLNSAFQSQSLVHYRESHVSPAWFQRPVPPHSVFQSMELRRRDFTHHSPTPVWLRPRPLLNSAFQSQSLVHYRESHVSPAWFQRPVPPHSDYSPSPAPGMWMCQHVGVRASFSQLRFDVNTSQGFYGTFPPEHRPADRRVTRRRSGRVHPYHPHLFQVTPRHHAYGW